MNPEMVFAIQTAGLLAVLGAFIYAIGDVLLLAGKANIADYPMLQPHAKLLSGIEKMVALSWRRMAWGGLLGVFATPLILGGFWLVYQGLASAGAWLALPPGLLFACATIVGAFVHGSFIYLGEYVQALNAVKSESQPVLLAMFNRHKQIMVITYGFVLGSIVVASIWYAVAVALGGTLFPRWMAAVNPVTTFLAWMLLKRLLPKAVTERTEGAGFNIAYLAFFVVATAVLW